MRFELWTDGACSGNPGPGGWAHVLVARQDDGSIAKQKETCDGDPATTNNQMELTAALKGLLALEFPVAVTVYTDSKYVVGAFTDGWLDNWQNNGWRKANKKQVMNKDLWLQLLAAADKHNVSWELVQGHGSTALNNRADRLAVHARDIAAGRIPPGTPPPMS